MIIFTDGGDNNSDNPLYVKREVVNSKVRRFAIGLKGKDFDKSALKDLATRRSHFVVARNIKSLKKAFERIAKQVATVYELDYRRSDQKLSKPIRIKYDFKVKKQRRK